LDANQLLCLQNHSVSPPRDANHTLQPDDDEPAHINGGSINISASTSNSGLANDDSDNESSSLGFLKGFLTERLKRKADEPAEHAAKVRRPFGRGSRGKRKSGVAVGDRGDVSNVGSKGATGQLEHHDDEKLSPLSVAPATEVSASTEKPIIIKIPKAPESGSKPDEQRLKPIKITLRWPPPKSIASTKPESKPQKKTPKEAEMPPSASVSASSTSEASSLSYSAPIISSPKRNSTEQVDKSHETDQPKSTPMQDIDSRQSSRLEENPIKAVDSTQVKSADTSSSTLHSNSISSVQDSIEKSDLLAFEDNIPPFVPIPEFLPSQPSVSQLSSPLATTDGASGILKRKDLRKDAAVAGGEGLGKRKLEERDEVSSGEPVTKMSRLSEPGSGVKGMATCQPEGEASTSSDTLGTPLEKERIQTINSDSGREAADGNTVNDAGKTQLNKTDEETQAVSATFSYIGISTAQNDGTSLMAQPMQQKEMSPEKKVSEVGTQSLQAANGTNVTTTNSSTGTNNTNHSNSQDGMPKSIPPAPTKNVLQSAANTEPKPTIEQPSAPTDSDNAKSTSSPAPTVESAPKPLSSSTENRPSTPATESKGTTPTTSSTFNAPTKPSSVSLTASSHSSNPSPPPTSSSTTFTTSSRASNTATAPKNTYTKPNITLSATPTAAEANTLLKALPNHFIQASKHTNLSPTLPVPTSIPKESPVGIIDVSKTATNNPIEVLKATSSNPPSNSVNASSSSISSFTASSSPEHPPTKDSSGLTSASSASIPSSKLIFQTLSLPGDPRPANKSSKDRPAKVPEKYYAKVSRPLAALAQLGFKE
jgi:hypothetical protein